MYKKAVFAMELQECRVCGDKKVQELLNFHEQPIVHNLNDTKTPKYRKFPFVVGQCFSCNFVSLMKPIDPKILYENYFTISAWKNQPHVGRLIQLIKQISNTDLTQRVLEIGCNDGSFLDALDRAGFKDTFGVEPTKDSYDLAISKDLNVKHDFFPNEHIKADYYDIVISRHVLEHIADLQGFFIGITSCIKDNGILVIEIPDSENTFYRLDYALWEEHVNYFTYNTLKLLLNRHGFEIIHYEKTLFSGVALTVFAQKVGYDINLSENSFDRLLIQSYKEKFPLLREALHNFIDDKKEVCIYGCGARSSNFVNFLGLSSISCFVDDQEEKQNKFVPGFDIPIVPWSSYLSNKYFLLGVNSENEAKLMQKRNLKNSRVVSVLPPSKNLPEFWKKLIIL